MQFLLFVFFFRNSLESRQSLIPQLRKVVSQFHNSPRIHFVNPPCPLSPVAHQPRIFQYSQMLRYRRPRNWHALRKFVHRPRMLRQHGKNRQSRRIAQCRQPILYVSIHLR